ncbi:unnamed protein product [Gadus morhua 'NCC']
MSCRKRCKREIFKFAQYMFRLVTGTLNSGSDGSEVLLRHGALVRFKGNFLWLDPRCCGEENTNHASHSRPEHAREAAVVNLRRPMNPLTAL